MLSQLSTNKITVDHLLVTAGGDPAATAGALEMDITPAVSKARDSWSFRVTLAIKMKWRTPARARFRRIEISVTGYFALEPEASEELVRQLVPLNCYAILHGYARGVLAQATGTFPGGPFTLPAVNFVELLKKQAQEQEQQEQRQAEG